MQEARTNLDKKWSGLIDQDERVDERTKRISEEIKKDFDEALDRAADANRDAAELIADGIKRYAESPAPTPSTGSATADAIITAVRGALGPTIGWWQSRNTRSAGRVSAYRSVFSSERRVLVMFMDVREDVEEFLEDNDFPKAEEAFAGAKRSAEDFVGKAKTSGQKSDAAEFRDDLLGVLAGHFKQTADVYGKFVSRHREKFFGALGPSIKRELLETDSWKDYARWVEGYGLESKLRTWQTKATHLFEVDLSKLPAESRKRLETGLRAVVDDLVDELKKAGVNYRDIVRVVDDEREDVEDELD